MTETISFSYPFGSTQPTRFVSPSSGTPPMTKEFAQATAVFTVFGVVVILSDGIVTPILWTILGL